LAKAHVIMMSLVKVAKARLELRTVQDYVEYLKWARAWVEFHVAGKSCLDGSYSPGEAGPWFASASGTTFVYPPPPAKGKTSLDYRWNCRQDFADSYLPSVTASQRRYPFPGR
jgi:hypothetical protein